MHNINEDLLPLAYSIDKLSLLPGNPRKGDVEAVMASLEKFGQRTPIVARHVPGSETGEVLAGNTRLKAAKRLGWTEIAVVWTEDDDATAAGYALADNRTHDLGEYDDENLYKMINQISDDTDLLDAAGYDLADEQELFENIMKGGDDTDVSFSDSDLFDSDDDSEEAEPKHRPKPIIQYTIIFEDEEQQEFWHGFVRHLKRTRGDLPTLAARLVDFLEEALDEDN